MPGPVHCYVRQVDPCDTRRTNGPGCPKAPMVWDNADGEDETVSATFDLFRIGRPGEIEIVERFAIDGDQWRMLECKGSVNVIPTRVRLGMELSKVVTEEISLG